MLEDDGTASIAERKSELTTSMLLGSSHSQQNERKLSANIEKKDFTSSVLLNSANHQVQHQQCNALYRINTATCTHTHIHACHEWEE